MTEPPGYALGSSLREGGEFIVQRGLRHTDAAPEQTGRINRSIDSRSDLYGLGALPHRAPAAAALARNPETTVTRERSQGRRKPAIEQSFRP
jgi:hypothetical protein